MFESATLKLTGWYLLILMTISLVFSGIIYQISISELNARLGFFESQIEHDNGPLSGRPDVFRQSQVDKANDSIFFALLYTNLAVLLLGGFASYISARRTLRPIEEAHEAQSRFTSDASHELRTPLAVMKSELEVALRDPKLTKEEMYELLQSNLEEVNRLSTLSMTLLQISRQEYSELKMTKINLSTIVKQLVKAHRLSPDRLQIEVEPGAVILGNDSSVRELLTILLDNALRYSPEDSLISMRVTKAKGDVVCEIANYGDGIAQEDLEHVFERFYRGNKARTTENLSGFGLGLSLAKKICDLHGALISLNSDPEKLTVATVTFKKLA